MRIRCEGESYTLFVHIFVKFFLFFYSFLSFGIVCALFNWSLIHICMVLACI